jgi:hypothetical protein
LILKATDDRFVETSTSSLFANGQYDVMTASRTKRAPSMEILATVGGAIDQNWAQLRAQPRFAYESLNLAYDVVVDCWDR